jgi:mediator of RNA polymerase II transcription subunit 17
MASNNQSPFSLRPWPTGDKKPKTLAEFITRVNEQPGGFRNLNEAQLRQEIQAKQQGRVDDGSSEDDDEDDDDEIEDDKTKTAIVAREEFLKNIESVFALHPLCATRQSSKQLGHTLTMRATVSPISPPC